jgi:hypothetical protein
MGISAAIFASILVAFSLINPLIPSRPPHSRPPNQHSSDAQPTGEETEEPFCIISPPPAGPHWPGPARTALLPVLLLDGSADGYGLRAGFWRMHRLLTGRPDLAGHVTVFATPDALRRCPAAAAAAREAGWEVGLLLPSEWAALGAADVGARCVPAQCLRRP